MAVCDTLCLPYPSRKMFTPKNETTIKAGNNNKKSCLVGRKLFFGNLQAIKIANSAKIVSEIIGLIGMLVKYDINAITLNKIRLNEIDTKKRKNTFFSNVFGNGRCFASR